jgi:hypothetical protein
MIWDARARYAWEQEQRQGRKQGQEERGERKDAAIWIMVLSPQKPTSQSVAEAAQGQRGQK